MSSPDDLDTLEPIRGGGAAKTLAVAGLLGLAAAGAWFVNDRVDGDRKARELRRAADAWSDLSRCLAGEHPRVGEVALTARRRELGIQDAVRNQPRAARALAWPWRCAPHARTLTRAIFESRTDDRRLRLLNQFASQAATDLEHAALHTGRDDARRYLDELFTTAERSGLPAGRASSVALPPPPVTVLSPRALRPLFAGVAGSSVRAEEQFSPRATHAILGFAAPQRCEFEADLVGARCARATPLQGAVAVRLAVADGAIPAAVRGDLGGSGPLFDLAEPDHPALSARASGALRAADRAWVALSPTSDDGARYTLRQGEATALAVPAFAPPPTDAPWMFSTLLFALVPSPIASATGDAGVADAPADGGATRSYRVIAGSLASRGAPWQWASAPSDRGDAGPLPEHPAVRACAFEARPDGAASTAVVAYGDDGHAAVLWHTSPTAFEVARAEARPGTLACGGGRVRMAWYARLPAPTVHVTTCTPAGCSHAEAPAPSLDATPAVAALGDRVLLAYTEEDGMGLRYRYGPLATIADAPATVVFDDAQHDGVQLDAPPLIVVRGDAAVVLASTRSPPATYALRVGPEDYRPVIVRAAHAFAQR